MLASVDEKTSDHCFALQALILEDVVKSRQVGEYEPPPSFAAPPGSTPLRVHLTKALWQYRCTAHPAVRKVVAALLVGMSLGVIWCEATIFTARKPDLSPFSLLIRWVFCWLRNYLICILD